eukprot:m.338137 g.338137  ORF g.338137 m.338137 type:complete len:142 (+) comp18321_c0_seq1:2432-2857(+)
MRNGKEFPSYSLPTKPSPLQLMKVPIGKIYKQMEAKPNVYGKLPIIAKAHIGALVSESFCERCLSIGNDVVTGEDNTWRSDRDISCLVVLRMNREVIETFLKPDHETLSEANVKSKEEAGIFETDSNYNDDFDPWFSYLAH